MVLNELIYPKCNYCLLQKQTMHFQHYCNTKSNDVRSKGVLHAADNFIATPLQKICITKPKKKLLGKSEQCKDRQVTY